LFEEGCPASPSSEAKAEDGYPSPYEDADPQPPAPAAALELLTSKYKFISERKDIPSL